MLYLLVFFSSLIVTIFSTPFLINFLTRLNIVDVPGGRRINTSAIPRMGGIIIYLIIILAIIGYTEDYTVIRFIIVSSGLLALCGILDDLRNLKWNIKYSLHSLSAGLILLHIYPMVQQVEFFGTLLPFPLDIIILFFFITGAFNAINMLDGMDGLVSGFSLLLFMLIFMLSFSTGDTLLIVISAASIGSLVGFLKFNANPARIFLGDTGSLVLGFFIVLSTLLLTHKINPHSFDLGFPVILLGVPLIDTLRVMMVRIWQGKSPFTPDNNHIHHMISGNNIRHKTTVFIIQAFTVLFIALSITYLYYSKFTAFVVFCFFSLILFNLNSIMHFFRARIDVEKIRWSFFSSSILTVDIYRKYLLPFSAVIVAALIFLLFPEKAHLSADIVLLMFVICSILLAASYVSNRREHAFNDIYVLINLLIFFSLTNLSEPWLRYNSLWGDNILLYLAAYSIIGIILLFFINRYKLFKDGRTLFSGLDMITLIILIFLIIMNNMLQIPQLNFIGGNIILGFTIYIWYKIAKFVIPGFSRPAYYFSFALPLATLIIISL